MKIKMKVALWHMVSEQLGHTYDEIVEPLQQSYSEFDPDEELMGMELDVMSMDLEIDLPDLAGPEIREILNNMMPKF